MSATFKFTVTDFEKVTQLELNLFLPQPVSPILPQPNVAHRLHQLSTRKSPEERFSIKRQQ